ncbi:MAG: V-type ATPase subunit [Thermoplasmata archaeon]|nr:V-type ATPase subunit [Thermoplasmata archaeon]MBE3138124.1 V-type ATPase subunit [Thermoplasmata archaeon]
MLEGILEPSSPLFWGLIIALISFVIVIISRPLATYIKFVYPNAKFEAIGNPFIHEKELLRLIESKDLTSFKDILNILKDYQVEGDDVVSLQRSLDKGLIKTVEMMENDSSKALHQFYTVYYEKRDLVLIKESLKSILSGTTKDTTLADNAYLPQTKELLNKLHEATKETLAPILSAYGYTDTLIQLLITEPPDFFKIDFTLDQHILNKFKEVKVPYKCERAKKNYCQRLLDIMNIKYLLRAKHIGYDIDMCKTMFLGEGTELALWRFKQMAEAEDIVNAIAALEGASYFSALDEKKETYIKEGSVQIFENTLDRLFLKHIKDISLQDYSTLGPTLRFLVSKEYEIQNLKVIVKGLDEHVSTDAINRFIVTEAMT